jgi:hypothetical protein
MQAEPAHGVFEAAPHALVRKLLGPLRQFARLDVPLCGRPGCALLESGDSAADPFAFGLGLVLPQ